MTCVEITDTALWIKHIHNDPVTPRRRGWRGKLLELLATDTTEPSADELKELLSSLPGGELVELEVGGHVGPWKKMADGADGRPTPGIKAVGRAREPWKSLQARRGDLIPIRLPPAPPPVARPAASSDAHADVGGGDDSMISIDPDVAEILRFLNASKVRATYTAVAQSLGSTPQSIGRLLGEKRIEASWVVNARTEMPTGYPPDQRDPDLTSSAEIIRSGEALDRRLSVWRMKSASTQSR